MLIKLQNLIANIALFIVYTSKLLNNHCFEYIGLINGTITLAAGLTGSDKRKGLIENR
jgi:hypothetical protein